ncbi:hypothetical protein ABZU75_40115 [Streptosporangium sp. NPDC005286]|uniref:hypothetical protein n=1 Tax=Streptosporangium sp. NPDC005286 TaxID=3154463 RepID=UPI0033AF23FF
MTADDHLTVDQRPHPGFHTPQVLGHSRLITIKRYTHTAETSAIEAAGRMGRALWDG